MDNDQEEQKKGRERAVGLVKEGLNGRGVTIEGCVDALETVKLVVSGKEGEGDVEEFRKACAGVFPMAEAFQAGTGAERGGN